MPHAQRISVSMMIIGMPGCPLEAGGASPRDRRTKAIFTCRKCFHMSNQQIVIEIVSIK
jgi:hypothetical protein